jgi:hypothetical protein
LQNKIEVKEWYNGHRCGSVALYNPWSILNCILEKGALKPYWADTSDNAFIIELIRDSDSESKRDLEALLSGKEIEQEIRESCSLPSIDYDSSQLWTMLLFAGYVTYSKHKIIDGKNVCTIKIPNKELQALWHDRILPKIHPTRHQRNSQGSASLS